MSGLDTTVIAIAGASGAGKSLLARQLCSRIQTTTGSQHVAMIHEDNYYLPHADLNYEQRCNINYDHPDALEHQLLAKHLRELRAGKSIQVPTYNYATHTRKSDTIPVEPSRVLIVEGILILHDPNLRHLFDLKIYVDVPLDICLIRRLRRDMLERGRSLDSVLDQYESTVRPMFHQFIEPTKRHADIIIPRGGENENALDVLYRYMNHLLM